ncbi:Zn-ribbon domain-containing protein [Halovenus rubra]|uniref:Zn-ribbon domain-containing protein n=2 Tax=Halovenus rubra TaxID=869890 RepID=A0ACC7DW30_9EURY|nr:Zn-ribbon containing protein [Halovenus rubra]
MPHQCTDCGRPFENGSKEMLSGCPECGGNTFQFRPGGGEDDDSEEPEETAPPEPPEPEVNSTVARTVGNAATAVRDLVGRGNSSPGYPDEPDPSVSGRDSPSTRTTAEQDRSSQTPSTGAITADTTTQEDAAQTSARTEVVSSDNLPDSPETPTRERSTPAVDESSQQPADEDRPDLDELREQLNEQFESIRVVAPGQYELNLMELYDREEYIVALQEDGKYTIQVPERWSE